MANNMERVKRREGRLSEKSCVGEGSEGWTEWERRRERPPPPPCRFGAGGANCSRGKPFALKTLGFQ